MIKGVFGDGAQQSCISHVCGIRAVGNLVVVVDIVIVVIVVVVVVIVVNFGNRVGHSSGRDNSKGQKSSHREDTLLFFNARWLWRHNLGKVFHNSCFYFSQCFHLVLVLLALFAPKEAVEREMKKGEKKNKTSDPFLCHS